MPKRDLVGMAEFLVEFSQRDFEMVKCGVGIDGVEVGAALIEAGGKIPDFAFGHLVVEIALTRDGFGGDVFESRRDE